MQPQPKYCSPAYRNVLVALVAVGVVSCAEILGLEPASFRDASVSFDGSAGDAGSTPDGASGARSDGSTDTPRDDAAGGSGGTGGSGGSAGKAIDGGSGAAGAMGSGGADAGGVSDAPDGSDAAGSIDAPGGNDATNVDAPTMTDVPVDFADESIVDVYDPPSDGGCTGSPTCTLDGKVQSCPNDGGPAVMTSCPVQTPYCIGAGQCVACTIPTQCPTPANECLDAACNSNQCGTTPVLAHTPLAQQTAGDCKTAACNGSGGTTTIADTNDVPFDNNTCTKDICTGDVPSNPHEMAGTPCTRGICSGGGVCGVCSMGSTQCSGANVQTCDATGRWGPATSCPSGLCLVDQCVPIATSTATSCQTIGAGRTNCGPDGNENCCKSLLVSGGTFFRGYDGQVGDQTGPATVSDFRLDAFEVTVGRFRAFLDSGNGTQSRPPAAGAGAHSKIAGSGWDAAWTTSLAATSTALSGSIQCNVTFATFTRDVGANETRPINCVNWYDAFAFCAWDGGRLSTHAERNYASSGGDEQRKFPWGISDPGPNGDLAAQTCYYGGGVGGYGNCTGVENIAPVGFIPAGNGKWGQSDLAGNVDEWVLDWYGNGHLLPCVDCARIGLNPDDHLLHGGDFASFGFEALRSAMFNYTGATTRTETHGIRCARTL